MTKFGSAAISWTDPGTGTERVVLLDTPLRFAQPGFSQTVYRAESLDKTAIGTVSVGSGAFELVGSFLFDDDPQGLLDMVRMGAVNTTLTYVPNLADPDQSYSVKLVSPTDVSSLTIDLDSQRATFGEMRVEVRFRQTDQAAFTETFGGTNALFSYRAGGPLADGTFARADTAIYATKGYGVSTSAASGKARVHWMDLDGDGIRETPTMLLEGSSSNLVVESANFTATWVSSGTPVLTGTQADPAGGTAAYLVADDDAVAQEYIGITPTFATNAVSKAVSLFVKQGTSLAAGGSDIQLRDTTAGADRLLANVTWSNGVPTVTMTTGTALFKVRWTNGWYRLGFMTTAVTVANTNQLRIAPASVAAQQGNIYAWGVQAENALNPTSYIPTAGGTDTRAADSLTFPAPWRVQTLTLYVRFVQNALPPGNASTSQMCSIGTSGASTRLQLSQVGAANTWRIDVADTAGTSASGTVAVAATHGQVVELLGTLTVTGSAMTATATLQAAIQGVIGTAGSASAAKQVSDNFNGTTFTVGNSAATAMVAPYTHVFVVRGAQTIQTMRKVAGV